MGGSQVRAKKWPENARPEWPDAELGAQDLPVAGDDIQSFPETGTTDVLPDGEVPDAGPTEVLAAVRAPGPTAHEPHAHDPLGVTVQLDADRIADERTHLTEPGRAPRGGGQDPSGRPVFVDASGRRRRTFRRLGMFAGIACAVYAVVIVATLLSGSSNAPWLPVPGQTEDKPAGQVDISPAPADSARPPARTGTAPGTGPRVPAAAPSPGGSAAASGATGTARQPGASTAPQPTATNPASGAGSAGGSSPDPEPTAPTPSTAPPTPTGPTGGSGSPSPSAGGDGGTGTGGPGGGTGTGNGPGTVAGGLVRPARAAAPTSV
ncbi:hypothetical protein [Streptomyces sp. NPDC020298]|uniref:hypothetical protein n=1 Tax=unclassified Streptomyces TaxID=2593676 RepID=UPI00340CDD52